uniref:Uncharacterized protein n=1 Tax=Glossina austeni TaxID=7395 RepID=A0A1A9UJ94_GLOAU
MPLNVIYIKFEYQLVIASDLGGLKLFKIIPQYKCFKFSFSLLSAMSRLCNSNSDLTKTKQTNPNQFKEHDAMMKNSLRPNIGEHYWKIDRLSCSDGFVRCLFGSLETPTLIVLKFLAENSLIIVTQFYGRT